MALISDTELWEQTQRRFTSMDSERSEYIPEWQNIARMNRPSLTRYLQVDGQGKQTGTRLKSNSKLLSSRAIRASEIMANGMSSGQCSPSDRWFTITTSDPEMRKFQAVKEWLDDVENRIYDLLAGSNFYNAVKSGFRELGVFGQEACFMRAHDTYGVVCAPLSAGEFWIAQDDAMRVDTLMRRCDMTVRQIYDRFCKYPGDDMKKLPVIVRDQYKNGQYETVHQVMHLVEPNRDRIPNRIDRTNKPFRSLYWMPTNNEKKMLEFGGFERAPFFAPRWDTVGGETYSSQCPGWITTPDTRQLQHEMLRKAQSIDFGVRPALSGPPTLANTYAALVPGGMTTFAGIDTQKFEPIWRVEAQMISAVRESVLDQYQVIDEGYYVDLFFAITNMRGIQPKNMQEIASRNEEKLTQLGPVTDRVQVEKLKVAVDTAFDILAASGMIPPAPDELVNMPLKIEFVSVLAQMQKMVRVGAIERYLSFGGNMVAVFPEIKDKIDAEAAMDEYAMRLGVPARMTRSDDKVAEIRQGRQQQERTAQMAAMAPAAVDGAKAAQLLSQTDMGNGNSLLQQMTGAA